MFNGHSNYIMRLINRLEMLFVILMRHWLRITQRQSEITRNPSDTADRSCLTSWPVEIQEFDAAFFGIAKPEAYQRLQTETAYVTWLVGSGGSHGHWGREKVAWLKNFDH